MVSTRLLVGAAQQGPASTRRRLLDKLGRLVFHDLAQRLFSNQSFLVDVLKHVPRRRVGLGTVVGVDFPIRCQSTPVVEIVRTARFTILVLVIVEISTLEWRGVV